MAAKRKKTKGKVKKKAIRRRTVTRDDRLRQLRIRKLAMSFLVVCLLSAAGTAYYMGLFGQARDWMYDETMRVTSDAGFKVNEILVTGRSEISADELLSRLSVKRDMPIFSLDIPAAQESLADITWVKGVTVSRRLPDTVFVDIEERQPVALWQQGKQLKLIDQEGVVLTTNNLEKWKELPLVVGKGARDHIEDLVVMLNAEPLVAKQVNSATRVGERRWNLYLNNGIVVKLPERDKEFALRRLVSLEQEKSILSKNITVVDLRTPEKLIVKLANQDGDVPLNSDQKKDSGA